MTTCALRRPRMIASARSNSSLSRILATSSPQAYPSCQFYPFDITCFLLFVLCSLLLAPCSLLLVSFSCVCCLFLVRSTLDVHTWFPIPCEIYIIQCLGISTHMICTRVALFSAMICSAWLYCEVDKWRRTPRCITSPLYTSEVTVLSDVGLVD